MNLSLSVQGFEEKPQPQTISLLKYSTVTVTPQELLERLRHGYCFHNHFSEDILKGEYKFINHFNGDHIKQRAYLGSYSVNFDFDSMDCSMKDFVNSLKIKPTFAYESWSNTQEHPKFRLIFCFSEEIMGKTGYQSTFDEIASQNGFLPEVKGRDGNVTQCGYDKCSRSPYQYMNGTSSKADYIWTGNILDIRDYHCENEIVTSDITTSVQHDSKFLEYFKYHSYTNVVETFIGKYRNIEHSPIPEMDDDTPYTKLPDDFYEIYRSLERGYNISNTTLYDNNNNLIEKEGLRSNIHPSLHLDFVSKRIKDGGKRRKTILHNLQIRRKITPDLTPDELLYCACYEMAYYIDNKNIPEGGNHISKQEILGIVDNAYQKDPKEVKYHRYRDYIVNPNYCLKNEKTKKEVGRQVAYQVRKEKSDDKKKKFFDMYDDTKTIKENVKRFKRKYKISISVDTVKKWRSQIKKSQEE